MVYTPPTLTLPIKWEATQEKKLTAIARSLGDGYTAIAKYPHSDRESWNVTAIIQSPTDFSNTLVIMEQCSQQQNWRLNQWNYSKTVSLNISGNSNYGIIENFLSSMLQDGVSHLFYMNGTLFGLEAYSWKLLGLNTWNLNMQINQYWRYDSMDYVTAPSAIVDAWNDSLNFTVNAVTQQITGGVEEGLLPFAWQPSPSYPTKNYICRQWQIIFLGVNIWEFSAKFEEFKGDLGKLG